MVCYFPKLRLTITQTYSRFRIQALHVHTLMLESNYTAHSSDQNSSGTGPESHTARSSDQNSSGTGPESHTARSSDQNSSGTGPESHTARSSDQNSSGTGPESHTALTTLQAVLTLALSLFSRSGPRASSPPENNSTGGEVLGPSVLLTVRQTPVLRLKSEVRCSSIPDVAHVPDVLSAPVVNRAPCHTRDHNTLLISS